MKKQLAKLNRIPPKHVLLFVVSAILFFILLTAVLNLGKKYFGLKNKLAELTQEKTNLVQKQEDLKAENEYLGSPEGEEHLLREKYQLVKPGEGLIVITNPDTDGDDSLKPKTGFRKFWDTILRGLGIRKD